MDVYYSGRFGKRMSWIIPISIVSAILYFIFAYSYEGWLESKDTVALAGFLFIQFVLVAIQDVAIDGMVCEILKPADYEKGSLMQTLG